MGNKRQRGLIVRPGSLGGLPANYRLNDLFDYMCSLFDDAWGNLDVRAFDALQPKTSFPKVNVSETKDNYEIEIAVAGFAKEDLALEVKDNALYIKGEKQDETKDCCDDDACSCKTFLRKEISSRSFRRMVPFQREIDSDNINCTFKDGIVKCTIGKKGLKEDDGSIKIDIN